MSETACTGRRKVSALEAESVERPEKNVNQKEKERVRDRPTLHVGIPWQGRHRQENVLQGNENQPTCFFKKKKK